MVDFGKDIGGGERPRMEETPQQRLKEIWEQRAFWKNGPEVKLTERIPEGMRLVMIDPHFIVLRSLLPGVPTDPKTGKPQDVPVAVFGSHVEPEYIRGEARELAKQIQEGEVWYVPPEEIVMG